MPDANPHKIELEAYGSDIPRLREFLADIELGSDLTRFRIEIESEKPIFQNESTEESSESSSETPKQEPESPENGHLTDKLNPDSETEVLSHQTDEIDKDEVETYSRNTNPWKLASFLYRQNEPLRLGHIHAYLEDTPLEIPYKTLSADLSKMKARNEVEVTNPQDMDDSEYRLTGKGEAKVAKTQQEAGEYILTMADKVAGLHPTSSFEPPELAE